MDAYRSIAEVTAAAFDQILRGTDTREAKKSLQITDLAYAVVICYHRALLDGRIKLPSYLMTALEDLARACEAPPEQE
jgi:hypothetical protein